MTHAVLETCFCWVRGCGPCAPPKSPFLDPGGPQRGGIRCVEGLGVGALGPRGSKEGVYRGTEAVRQPVCVGGGGGPAEACARPHNTTCGGGCWGDSHAQRQRQGAALRADMRSLSGAVLLRVLLRCGGASGAQSRSRPRLDHRSPTWSLRRPFKGLDPFSSGAVVAFGLSNPPSPAAPSPLSAPLSRQWTGPVQLSRCGMMFACTRARAWVCAHVCSVW